MTQAERLADNLEVTRKWTAMLLADLDDEDKNAWGHQLKPGGHHILWLVGHMALAEHALIHVRCAGKPALDDSFRSHFAPGGPVKVLDEHPFPSPREVRAKFDEVHAGALKVVRGMRDADLDAPAGGKPHPMFETKGGAILHAARHEAFHAGQIAVIRRALGKSFIR